MNHKIPIPAKATLEKFIADGVKAIEAAARLGVSRTLLQNWERHYDLRRRRSGKLPVPPENEINAMVANGHSSKVVAERYDVGRSTAQRWMRICKESLEPPRPKPVKVEIEFLSDDHPLVRFMESETADDGRQFGVTWKEWRA